MNPFLSPPAERLADWKQFRQSLATIDETHQLAAVAAYWANAPLMASADRLDQYARWPTIWEMIHANQWCRNSVAIGMEATLRLAGMAVDRLILRLIHDRIIQAGLLVLVVDDTWLLNYDWGFVRHYTGEHPVMQSWYFTGRDYCTFND